MFKDSSYLTCNQKVKHCQKDQSVKPLLSKLIIALLSKVVHVILSLKYSFSNKQGE